MAQITTLKSDVRYTIEVGEVEMAALVRGVGLLPAGDTVSPLYTDLCDALDGDDALVGVDGSDEPEPVYTQYLDDYWVKIARIDIVIPTTFQDRINVFQVKNHIRKYIEENFGIPKMDVRTSIEPVASKP